MPPQSNQVTLDFDKLTEKGLKPVLKKFEKQGCPVASVEATNKGKRESGVLVKAFVLTVEDGQKIAVKVKAGGAIFQVKLNGKIIPIRYTDDIEKAISEIVGYVHDNAKSYAKGKIQAARRKLKPQKPRVTTTRKEKFNAAKEDLGLVNENIAGMEKDLKIIQNVINEYTASLTKAEADLAVEKKRTETLTAEIEDLQKKNAA